VLRKIAEYPDLVEELGLVMLDIYRQRIGVVIKVQLKTVKMSKMQDFV